MAIKLVFATDSLIRNSGTMPSGLTVTIMGWFYWTVGAAPFPALAWFGPNTHVSTYIWIGITTSATRLDLDASGTSVSGATFNGSTWYHAALVKNGAASHIVYLDGVAIITDTTNIGTVTNTRLHIGCDPDGANDGLTGRVAAIKVWDAALTAAEIANERWSYRAQRRANLFGEYPCVDRVVADNALDISGNARDLTTVGTLAVETGPPIRWSAARRRTQPDASLTSDAPIGYTTALTTMGGLVGRRRA